MTDYKKTDKNKDIFKLSTGQELLWSLYQFDPQNPAYNTPFAFRMEENVNLDLLEKALQRIVYKYPILRSNMAKVEGESVRVVNEQYQARLKIIPQKDKTSEELIVWMQEITRKPFDLKKDRLYQFYLIESKEEQIFLANFHHIIFDGISTETFIQELKTTYIAFQTGAQTSRLTNGEGTPVVDYNDFVKWQQTYLESEQAQISEKYWKDVVEKYDNDFELPYDRNPSRSSEMEGKVASFSCPPVLKKQIDDFSNKHNITPYIFALSIYGILLNKYSQAKQVLVASPVNGRPESRFENTLGLFMNVNPIVFDFNQDISFLECFQVMDGQIWDAFEHSYYPVHQVIRTLKDKSVYKTAFYFQNWILDQEGEEQDPLFGEPIAEVRQTGEFDLTFEVTVLKENWKIDIKYNAAVFDTLKIENIYQHFLKLIETALDKPNLNVDSCALISDLDLSLYQKINNTFEEEPIKYDLLDLLEKQVLERPDKTAVIFKDQQLTYKQLSDQTDQLAVQLMSTYTVEKEEIIGVYIDRSLEMLLAMLAIQKIGASYLPFDISFPENRIFYMAQDAKITKCLVHNSTVDTCPLEDVKLIDIRTIDLTNEKKITPLQEIDLAKRKPNLKDRAYVLYTSGSTGNPKGVEIEHVSLSNFLQSMQKAPGMNEQDYLLALTTNSFDISGLELYLPLVSGATLEILPTEILKEGKALLTAIQNAPATVIQATPSTWQMLLNAGLNKRLPIRALCGGENLSRALADKLLDKTEELWNLFGPTETTIWSTISKVEKGEKINIGTPIQNTSVYILNAQDQLLPIGIDGELYIGGEGLARAYFDQPAITADRFKMLSINGEKKRLYKTGDIARIGTNGLIEYKGRNDFQIKLRGYRIEIQEIENIMLQYPTVKEAVVVVKENELGKSLIGFVKTDKFTEDNEAALLIHLNQWLPAYMVPVELIFVNDLPYTLNNKIDRSFLTNKSLKKIKEQFTFEQVKDNAPVTQIKKEASIHDTILEVVSSIIKEPIDEIETDKKLGALGFDSINFTSLSDKIENTTGVLISPNQFYQYDTIDELVSFIQTQNTQTSAQKETFEETPISQIFEQNQEIAVIGMMSRFPDAEDKETFWKNILQQKESVTEIPKTRWDWRDYFSEDKEQNKSKTKWGGFINEPTRFDAAFFGISPREATLMDPQQRILLEMVWEVVEDAGYRMSELQGSRTGIFVASSGSDFFEMQVKAELPIDAYTLVGVAKSILPNRISYLFDWRGPSEPIDTACSSSLVAINRAIGSMHSGECDMAVAAGINLILSPAAHVASGKMGMMSDVGKCQTFDLAADGYVRGEGCGIVLLKSLDKAIKDKDHIYAIVRSTAINHGGKANSLTAPNAKSQAALISDALLKTEIEPSTITYVETHGTGTPLGDPIEVEGLKLAFNTVHSQLTNPDQTIPSNYCGLSSVKTNIGHLEAAAGIAGFIKTVLALKEKTLPALANFKTLNPHVILDDSPFYLLEKNKPWDRMVVNGSEIPRRAGVSSFGFGGVNAHLVLEEYCPIISTPSDKSGAPFLFLLSAKTPAALERQTANLLNFVKTKKNSINALYLAFTLQQGREVMKYRTAILAENIAELIDSLEGEKLTNYWTGVVQSKKAKQATLNDHGIDLGQLNAGNAKIMLSKIAQIWVDHQIKINWENLYGDENGKLYTMAHRIATVTYPFEHTRFWPFDTKEILKQGEVKTKSDTYFDALIREEGKSKFIKKLSGEEHFFSDHIVHQQKVLPGVYALELIRAGMEELYPNQKKQIQDHIWIKPVIAEKESIELHLFFEETNNDKLNYQIKFKVNQQLVPHAQGTIKFVGALKPIEIAVPIMNDSSDSFLTKEECYVKFSNNGFDYGKSLQTITEVFSEEGKLQGNLQAEKKYIVDDFGAGNDKVLYPSIMDGALQLVALSLGFKKAEGDSYLPFSIGRLSLFQNLVEDCQVLIDFPEQKSKGLLKCNVSIFDQEEQLLCYIQDYSLKRIPNPPQKIKKATTIQENRLLVYKPKLIKVAPLSDVRLSSGHWITCGFDSRVIKYLKESTEIKKIDKLEISEEMIPTLLRMVNEHEESELNLMLGDKVFENITASFLEEQEMLFFKLYKSLIDHFPNKKINVLILQLTKPDKALIDSSIQSAMTAFAKSLNMENPKVITKIVSIETKDLEKCKIDKILLNEWQNIGEGISEVFYKDTIRYLKNYEPLKEIDSFSTTLKEKGLYLIAGAGKLGIHLAEHLSQQYNATVALTGRSEKIDLPNEKVVYYQTDLSNRDELTVTLDKIRSSLGEINGVIHTAGKLSDNFFLKKEADEFLSVLKPKVLGLLNLDELTKEDRLDFLVGFSSTSAVFGNIGQTDYALANGFIDEYLKHREVLRKKGSRHGLSLSFNWGLWKDGKMTMPKPIQERLKRKFGLDSIDLDMGIKAFEKLLGSNASQLVVVNGIPEKIKETFIHLNPKGKPYIVKPKNLNKNKIMNANILAQKTPLYLKGLIAKLTHLDISSISDDQEFEELGIDSVMILELNEELEKTFPDLQKTLFFEYFSIKELAPYFIENYQEELMTLFEMKKEEILTDLSTEYSSPDSPSDLESPMLSFEEGKEDTVSLESDMMSVPQTVQREQAYSSDDIAVIGLNGKYPQADNLIEFWDKLSKGVDCISEVPAERWDAEELYDETGSVEGKATSKWGGFVNDIDKFDPLFFNISPAEAELLDPQERLFLQSLWHTMEDAGYTRKALENKKVGVFVGVMWGHYQLYGGDTYQDGTVLTPMSSYASIANRVSYFFNFRGPSIALDTMCSSSLTTIHLACESILRGESDLAFAGGVNLTVHKNKYIFLSKTNFMSTDGRCHTFGEGGDGYVPGEGVGAVFLKPLSKAIADKDHIYGVIKGSAVNHGGKASGYTVPNPRAQAEVISSALEKSKINPRSLSYIEAHGTGTSLGDPIEINGLNKVFKRYTSETSYCPIGSVKSNIGHCESAAGIAAVSKVLLQLKNRKIVPSLHAQTLNPNINFRKSPFFVPQKIQEWTPAVYEENGQQVIAPLRAGVSSFGAGGANAHLIIEEFNTPVSTVSIDGKGIFILSAKNKERLKEYAQLIIEFLNAEVKRDTKDELAPELKMISFFQNACRTILNIPDLVLENNNTLNSDLGMSYREFDKLEQTISDKLNIQLPPNTLFEYVRLEDLIHFMINNYPTEVAALKESVIIQMMNKDVIDFYSFIYTYQIGREDMEERLAIPAHGFDDLLRGLDLFLKEETSAEYFANRVPKKDTTQSLLSGEDGSRFVQELIQNKRLEKIALLWVSGIQVDWQLFYLQKLPKLPQLPVYPFAKDHCWLPEVEKINPQSVQFSHPLVDKIAPQFSLNKGLTFVKRLERKNHFIKLKNECYMVTGDLLLNLLSSGAQHIYLLEQFTITNWELHQEWTFQEEYTEVYTYLNPVNEELIKGEIFVLQGEQKIVLAKAQINLIEVEEDSFEPYALSDLETTHTVEIQKNKAYTDSNHLSYFLKFESNQSKEKASGIIFLPELYDIFETLILNVSDDDNQINGFYIKEAICNDLSLKSQYGLVKLGQQNSFEVIFLTDKGEVTSQISGLTFSNKELILDRFFYTPEWVPINSESTSKGNIPAAEETKKALIIYSEDCNEFANQWNEQLENRDVVLLKLGAEDQMSKSNRFEINVRNPASFVNALSKIPVVDEICFITPPSDQALYSTDRQQYDNWQYKSLYAYFNLVKAMTENDWEKSAIRINLIGQAANIITGKENTSAWFAGLTGFARASVKEYAKWKLVSIEIDFAEYESQLSAGKAADFFKDLNKNTHRDRVGDMALRDGLIYTRKLTPSQLPAATKNILRSAKGVYLIFGGNGNVGYKLAKHLAKHYKAIIILAGRSALNERTQGRIQELVDLGGIAEYLQIDIKHEVDIKKSVSTIKEKYGVINGVFHSALNFNFELIKDMDLTSMEKSIEAKTIGSINIGKVFRKEALDFLLYFSSAEAFTGNPGWGAYSGACYFSDSFAKQLNTIVDYPVKVINWGFWQGNDGGFEENLIQKGIIPIKEEIGMEAISRVLAAPTSQVLGLNVSDKILKLMGADLSQREGEEGKVSIHESSDTSSFVIKKRTSRKVKSLPINITVNSNGALDEASLLELTKKYCRETIARVAKIDATRMEDEVEFMAYGIDSLIITDIHKAFEEGLGTLPVTFLLENENLLEMATFLIENHKDLLTAFFSGESSEIETIADTVSDKKIDRVRDKKSKKETVEEYFQLLNAVDRSEINDMLFTYGDKYQNSTLMPAPENIKTAQNIKALDLQPEELNHLLIKTKENPALEVFTIGRGQPILLIPAIGLTAPIWLNQINDWQKGYQIIIIHNPGYGLSELCKDITVENVGSIFMDVLTALEIKKPINIVGSCFGGVLAQYIAMRYKERVASLSLIGSFYQNFGLPDMKIEDLTIDQMIEGVKMIASSIGRDFDVVTEALNGMYPSEEKVARSKELLMKSQCVNALVVMRYITQILVLSSESWLSKIEAPTLCIAGTVDTIVAPEISKKIAQLIPEAEYQDIEGSGHYPYLTHTSVFEGIVLDFIKQNAEKELYSLAE